MISWQTKSIKRILCKAFYI